MQSSSAGKCDGSAPCNVTENNAGMKQLANYKENIESNHLPVMHNTNSNIALGLLKQEELLLPSAQAGSTWATNLTQSSMGVLQKARLDVSTSGMQAKDNFGSVAHPNLNITLGAPSGNLQATSNAIVDEREQRKMSDSFHQGFGPPPSLLATPPKLTFSPTSDATQSVMPQIRVARPPIEGRGRHQLLPRYWPRITDQELQQITGEYPFTLFLLLVLSFTALCCMLISDRSSCFKNILVPCFYVYKMLVLLFLNLLPTSSNCTIVPLFEKVLSASDAGRIGRLVLPKACAEVSLFHPPSSRLKQVSFAFLHFYRLVKS